MLHFGLDLFEQLETLLRSPAMDLENIRWAQDTTARRSGMEYLEGKLSEIPRVLVCSETKFGTFQGGASDEITP